MYDTIFPSNGGGMSVTVFLIYENAMIYLFSCMRKNAKIDKMGFLGGKIKIMKKAEKDIFDHLKAQFDKVINAYGWTEQGRLAISTMMLMVVYDAKDVARNLSKATFYRHMAMLKDSGVDLNESVYNELKEIYKLPKEIR